MSVGPYFAVTSFSGRAGAWKILADGTDPVAVKAAAITTLGGLPADGSYPPQFSNLQVLHQARAVGLVGVAGLQQYQTSDSTRKSTADTTIPLG